ncbi:MAG: FAD-dependent oxidoreductase [Chloroflexota bacterium]
MKDQARIVIIGGGIAGCSIAYHLAMMGQADVILLDKGELTSGSTWHAAGLVTQFHTSPSLMRMRIYSVNLYRHLQATDLSGGAGEQGSRGAGEQGSRGNESPLRLRTPAPLLSSVPVIWHQVGSLRLASTQDHFWLLKRQVGQAKALGMDVEVISAAEALRIFPYMTDASLYGALYIPGDGHLDPSGATFELARWARAMGVQTYTGVRVTGIQLSAAGAVQRVQTDHGDIRTELVINAAGMWAPQVGAMVGVNLPMVPLVHQHLTTRPIPGYELPRDTPVLRDPYHLFYMREEGKGFLIGGFEVEPQAWSVDGVPWDFTQKLLPPDWELFEPIMEGAIRRVPILAQAEVAHLLNGPEAITPDSRPLLGPVPGLRGYWVAAGLSHTGFGAGGAIGQIMAEWIIEGEPSWPTHEFNVRRFGTIYQDRHFTTERARESYRYYYFLRYPNDENESVRPYRRSPLHTRLEALGAVFGEKNGWERVNYFDPGRPSRRAGADQKTWGWGRPPYFEQVGEEHRAVRERAALFDMTSFGKIDVRGTGALALLQKVTDNNLDKPVGSLTYTQMLNGRGGIESDLTVMRLADDTFRVITGSNFVAADLGWLIMHGPQDGSVEMQEVTDEWACIGLWGPFARHVLQAVCPDDVSNAAFPYMTARTVTIDGVEVLAQRVTYVGELGWEFYAPNEQAGRVWDGLLAAGQPYNIRPAGYKALDSLRLEKSYRYWSADITPTDNPYEAGLGFCVRLNKGEFIGREALLAAKAQGIQRKLCTLAMDGDSCVLYGGEAVYRDGRVVGRLRSGGYGYTVGKNIGLAYLPLELAAEGTPLEVEVFGERVAAEVAAEVLYDPKGEYLRN